MKTIQITAKNVQKAIEQGLKELNASQDEVDIKILDEGGFFKKAKVELTLDKEAEEKQLAQEKATKLENKDEEVLNKKEDKKLKDTKKEKPKKQEKEEAVKEEKEENKSKPAKSREEVIEYGKNFLMGLFERMNVTAEISTYGEVGSVTFNASGEKVSTLIGKRGETLNAIQEVLTYVMKNAGFRDERYYFDVENYKSRREMSLVSLAERMAKKALKIEKPIKLERMSAYERKIIHTALQDKKGITTKSEGEEPNRFLVIIPVKEEDENTSSEE